MSVAERALPAELPLAADAAAAERLEFIKRTYLHLFGAVLAFVGLEVFIFTTPAVLEPMIELFMTVSPILILGAFIGVSWLADRWATRSASRGVQYAALAVYVVAEAVIFVPLLLVASLHGGPDVIPVAGLITLLMFSGLTVFVFFTRADFSPLRPALMLGGLLAFGLAIASVLFGWNLGNAFTIAMIGLASGWVLYDTSNVIHRFRTDQHVAASLALFASVALLFWYILKLTSRLNRN